jgi:hypothetical protein
MGRFFHRLAKAWTIEAVSPAAGLRMRKQKHNPSVALQQDELHRRV